MKGDTAGLYLAFKYKPWGWILPTKWGNENNSSHHLFRLKSLGRWWIGGSWRLNCVLTNKKSKSSSGWITASPFQHICVSLWKGEKVKRKKNVFSQPPWRKNMFGVGSAGGKKVTAVSVPLCDRKGRTREELNDMMSDLMWPDWLCSLSHTCEADDVFSEAGLGSVSITAP